MLLLPNGQVLFANGSTYVAVYTPAGGPQASWRPAITSVPTTLQQGHTYTLQGRRLNGFTQACGYGDDAQMATNYPIVRLQYPSGQVVYCRTANHSTMAVATGAAVVSTTFAVPPGAPSGSANLVVIANGIPSAATTVHVGVVKKIEKLEKFEKLEIKELKIEKLEHIEKLAKAEIGEKLIVEIKVDETKVDETFQNQQFDLNTIVEQLTTRIEELSTTVQQHAAFIQQQERPAAGEPPAPEEAPAAPHETPPPRHQEHKRS
jgi:hypothetical protein